MEASSQKPNLIPRPAQGEARSTLVERPPVVVIMGHVDHGKTTILDYIRKTRVAAKEAGGITQHLGAYEVEVPSASPGQGDNRKITFLDTPGHEAFNKIRERGSAVADVAVLVVAAEEGLKPQTLEALSYIQNAKLPFIIAINKIDRPSANPDKVKQQFAEKNVFVEGWGGSVPVVETSGKTGQGIDTLLELILLLSDMEQKKADPDASPEGVVIESSRDAKRGVKASVLVLDGTLRRGDVIYTQSSTAKVKILENFLGKTVDEISFSSPASIIGWESQPQVGEWFSTDESAYHAQQANMVVLNATQDGGEAKNQLKLILKADVSGSLEALETVIGHAIEETKNEYLVVDKSIGDITLSDLKTAEASGAIIVAFRSDMLQETCDYIQSRPITVVKGDIIYHLAEEVQKIVKQHHDDITVVPSAKGEVIMLFSVKDNRNRQVVGVHLTEGTVSKNDRCVILRAGEKIGDAKVLTIKRNKDEYDTIDAECECGLQLQTGAEPALHDLLEFSSSA